MRLDWPLSVPVLDDGEVALRAHAPTDVDAIVELAQDPESVRWTAIPTPYARADAEDFALRTVARGWDAGTHRGWAIEAPDDDGRRRYAGNVDVRGLPIADLGFVLHPWARGRGVMTRAVRLAVDWAFTEGGVEIVHWRSQVGNEASLRVAHAAGFTLHAVTPGLLHERGRVLDAWTGSLRFGDAPFATGRWAEPVTLEADGVRLRRLRDSDVPRVVEACSHPSTQHWLANLPRRYGEPEARAHLADTVWQAALGATATWAAADAATDQLLGTVAVMHLQSLDASGEIGYWSHPDARGRGVMTAAVRLLTEHAFDPDGLDRQRLVIHAAVSNVASNAVAAAAGFRPFGVQRRAERLGDGSLDDLAGHELLRA